MGTPEGCDSECVAPVNGTDDRGAHPKFWIAVYTRPRSEKKVSAQLSASGIETYLPVQRQLRVWSDRRKFVEVPVIPMIVFVRVTEENLRKVLAHPLIIRYIPGADRKGPAHIPSRQIDNLKLVLAQKDIPVSFENGIFKSDENVRVIRGSLAGLTGQVKAVKDNMTVVRISIDMLGGAIMEISSADLEHIKDRQE